MDVEVDNGGERRVTDEVTAGPRGAGAAHAHRCLLRTAAVFRVISIAHVAASLAVLVRSRAGSR